MKKHIFKERKAKEEKGITLIALIITIVVLLILALVSIRAVQGDGILSQATRSKQENEKASIIEEIKLDIMSKQIYNLGSINEDEFYEILEKYGTVSADKTTLTTTKGNYEILISDIYGEEISSPTRNSNNIIDYTTLQYGKQNYNDRYNDLVSAICTQKIPIEANTTYVTNRKIQCISYYDSEDNYIGFENLVDGTYLANGFTTKENAAFAIITIIDSSYLKGEKEQYDEYVKEWWIGKIDDINYEKFGTVNTKSGYSNIIKTEKVFYNTMCVNGQYFSYAKGACCSIIKPKENVPFYVNGITQYANAFYLNEDMTVINKEVVNPPFEYFNFNTYEYPTAKYMVISSRAENANEIKMEYYYKTAGEKSMQGKIIVGYGDSMTQDKSNSKVSWLGKVANYFGMTQYNRGIGGTRVTPDSRTAWVTPEGEFLATEIAGDSEPTEEHITINSSMSHDDRISTIPSNADIVLFFGGANGVDNDSYKMALDKIKKQAPNAKIICVNLPFRKVEDETYQSRRDTIDRVAKEYNYPVIQLKELMKVDETNCDNYMADVVHWNNAGKTKMALCIIDKITEYISNGYL